MSAFQTIAGQRFFIGPAMSSQATDVAESDFAGLIWTEIDGWVEKGDYGDEYELIEEAIINRGRVAKIKGTANGGSMENVFVRMENDPGQIAFRIASAARREYAFKIERPGPENSVISEYFLGLAMSGRRVGGDANTSDRVSFTVEITTNVVEYEGDPVPAVILNASAAGSIVDNVPINTQVATFATDAETVTLSGPDASRLVIVGNAVRTAESIVGRTSLSFTINGTATDKLPASRAFFIPVTAYVPPPATLTVTVVPNLYNNIAAGTVVANFTTNGSVTVAGGVDAGRVEVVGLTVRTTEAVTGRSGLSFTLTATAAGYSPQNRSVTVPLANYVPGTVALTVSPVSNLQETAPIGTVVATFTTDGTPALSGADAGILAINGNSVVTTAALTDKGTLNFTVTATDADKTPASQTVSMPVAEVAPPTVSLVVTPTNNLDASAPVGTIVASFTTNADEVTLSGDDAGLLEIAGTTVITTAAISAGTLVFVLTGTAAGMLAQARNVSVTIAAEPLPTLTYSNDATAVTGLWVGYPAEEVIVSAILPNATEARLVVSETSDLANPISGPIVQVEPGGYFLGTCGGLQLDHHYYCGIRIGNVIYTARKGQFTTFPPANEPASFRFGFGNCNSGTTSSAFTAMTNFDPLFVQHLGDFYYADITQNDESLYHAQINSRFTNEQGVMMQNVPTFWIWDDHDFGPDGADMNNPGRPAALASYRKRAPAPPMRLSGALDPIDYAFTVGRVRFIVPDGRSQRISGTRYLHPDQISWMETEMALAASLGNFICLAIGLPWFAGEMSGSDRTRIGNFIAANGLEGRVFSINGDAHSIQVDDGTNVNLATVGSARMPSIHAAPFSQGNSTKGQAIWSHGRYSESTRQAGYIDVIDGGGDEIDLHFVGYKDNGVTVVTFDFQLSKNGYIAGPSFVITPDKAYASEGETITFTITSNQPLTTQVVNLTGVQAGDISDGSLSYSVNLDIDGNGSFTITMAEDLLTEGPETLVATIAGTTASVAVGIYDTSQSPPVTSDAPFMVQQQISYARTTAQTTEISLAVPATAGNLLIIHCLVEKNITIVTPPEGFTLLTSHTGSGVSAYIYTKIAEGGEVLWTVEVANISTGHRVINVIETDAAAIDQYALGTTNASTNSRGSSAQVTAAEDTLAIATWHNDSNNTSSAATSASVFGEDWTIVSASGLSAAWPNLNGSEAYSPAWAIAIKPVTNSGALTAAVSYVGGTSDENMVTLLTARY